MSAQLTLITPGPHDAERLSALMQRCFTDTFGQLYAPKHLAAFLDTQSPERWRAELADPALAIRLALAGGEPVGFAKVGPVSLPVTPRGPAAELRQLYLIAEHQGTGLAQRLIAWVLDESRGRGARELFLSVFVDNHRARRFYERHGFRCVGAYTFMVGDHADEDDLMRLVL